VESLTPFEPLPAAEGGPSKATRHGGTVRHPAQPFTPTVHALLRHLEAVGFAGAPRVVGDGFDADGNEVLTYVDGTIVHPYAWSDEGVWHAGRVLRELHAATASFQPPPDARWCPWWMHRDGPGTVIGHCDAGPWHFIARDGLPVALIDWDLAGPVDPLDEVAVAGWWNAQLHDDDIAALNNLPDAATRANQLRLFLDGYELPGARREGLVTRMIELAIRNCAAEAIGAGITRESRDPTPLWALAWMSRGAAWMIRHRPMLEQALLL
jgi:hypothetical protein